MNEMVERLLRGAVEVHVHSYPDIRERKQDDLNLVKDACQAGMRGILLKSHIFSTCERAYLLNRIFSNIHVMGSLVLNETIGGFNPKAVEAAIKMGAYQIWMPTLSAANHAYHLKNDGSLSILNGNNLKPEVIEILKQIAEANIVLATGHLSPEEVDRLVDEALSHGVNHISITHPDWGVTKIPILTQQRLANTGHVVFERCLVCIEPDLPMNIPIEQIANTIRQVGVETTILSTDYGMPHYPTPVEGMKRYIQIMLNQGFSFNEIQSMVNTNPTTLYKLYDRAKPTTTVLEGKLS